MIDQSELTRLRVEGEKVAEKIERIEKDALKGRQEQRRKLNEQIVEKSKELFGSMCESIFERHPLLESFSWTQYTPYFNDGDECVFRVCNEYLPITFNGKEFEEVCDWTFDEKGSKYHAEEQAEVGLKEAFLDIRKALSSIDESDYKLMFGDHVKIVVTKPGTVEVERYSHD